MGFQEEEDGIENCDMLYQARVSELQTEERRLRESLDTATSRAQVLLLVMSFILVCVN